MQTEKNIKSNRRKKTLKIILAIILTIAIALTLTILLAVPAYLSSGNGQKLVMGKINASINGKTDLKTLSFNWHKGFEITQLNFQDPTSQIHATVKHLTIKPNYFSVPLFKSFDLLIKDGNLKVSDPKTGTVELVNINSKMDLRSPGRKTNFDINLSVTQDGKASPITAAGYIQPKHTTKGWTIIGTNADFSIKIDDLDLESLAPLLAIADINLPAAGKLNADINAKIQNGKFKHLDASALLSDARIIYMDTTIVLDEPVKINAKTSASGKSVIIDDLNITSSFCRITCTGQLDPDIELEISTQIDLDKAQPIAHSLKLLPEKLQLGGKLDSKLSLKEQKGIYHLTTDASNIKNFKLTYPDKKPFEQSNVSLSFDARINPAKKQIEVKTLKLTSPQIKIDKAAYNQITKNNTTTMTGRAQVQYDWSAITDLTQPYLPEGLILKGKRKDDLEFKTHYPAGQSEKITANLNTKARLGFQSAQYMGLYFGATETDIEIQNGLLTIHPFTSPVNNGKVNFAASADFNKKPVLLITPGPLDLIEGVHINDEMAEKLLKNTNPIFVDAANVKGIVNLHSKKLAIPLSSADKNSLEMIGTMSIDQLNIKSSGLLNQILSATGVMQNQKLITIHPTDFVIKDGFLKYDDMQMDVGINPLNFRGVIGLDETLDMTVTLPYTISGKTVKTGRKYDSPRITLPLTGTVTKPILDLSRLLTDQLQQQAEELIIKQLEKLFKKSD